MPLLFFYSPNLNAVAEKPTQQEKDFILELAKRYVHLDVLTYGQAERSVVRIDKRPNMYGGEGVVYLLHMFDRRELVNNRIGCYMILPAEGDESGFHTHGPRTEEELYVVMSGSGLYRERAGEAEDSPVREKRLKPGMITAVKHDGFHAVRNTDPRHPLILFVITTNEPES